MKHLRKFEGYYDPTCKRCYWYVPTEDGKLQIALKKIGAPQRYIDKMTGRIRVESFPEYIYVGEYMEDDNWAWDGTMQNFEVTQSTYMGKVEVDDSEVSADKYNL